MCEYCKNHKKLMNELELGDIFILYPATYSKIGDGFPYIIPTNFCPACGEKLRDCDE